METSEQHLFEERITGAVVLLTREKLFLVVVTEQSLD